MPALKKQYVETGLARVGFRYLPLPIHNRAERAAESAECASQQGQFWTMHDALFKNPAHLEESDFVTYATAIGLDGKQFDACLANPPSDRVKRDIDIAHGFGLSGTPSFIVGTLERGSLHATAVLIGTRPIEEFKRALDGALASVAR